LKISADYADDKDDDLGLDSMGVKGNKKGQLPNKNKNQIRAIKS